MNRVLLNLLLVVSGAIVAACQSASTPTANQPASTTAPSDVSTNQETLPATSFNSEIYLLANPDVAKQIKTGKYKSALEHYEKVGKSGKNAEGEAIEGFFTGTPGNDTIKGFGQSPGITGVNLELVSGKKDPFPLRPTSKGVGEVDILIATKGSTNQFLLGSFISSVNPKPEPFYVGKGDADYARIQNFTKGKDALELAGKPAQYKFVATDGNFRVLTASGDLVAIVEGVKQLKVAETSKEAGIFTMK